MEELNRNKKDFEEIIKAKDRELKETKVWIIELWTYGKMDSADILQSSFKCL